MGAGERDRKITLIEPSETTGDAAITENIRASFWAKFTETGGSLRSGLLAEKNCTFESLYPRHLEVNGVLSIRPGKWRVGMGARRFDIVSVVGSQRSGLTINALELV